MKLCKYCLREYPESEFGVAKTTPLKIYRRLKCKFCYYKSKNEFYNKQRMWLADYKNRQKCYICGNSDFRVLDFHHLVDKEFSIADQMYYHYSFDRLKEEVKKCMVLCANCHRVLHYEATKRAKNDSL